MERPSKFRITHNGSQSELNNNEYKCNKEIQINEQNNLSIRVGLGKRTQLEMLFLSRARMR
jgi:hypothetical protein